MKFILIFFIVIICQSQTVNVVALRVDFVADNSEFTTGNGKFDLRNPDPDSVQQIIIDPPPHNRLYFEDHLTFAKNYFNYSLDIDLNFAVYPTAVNDVYHLPKQMAYYNPNLPSDSLKGLTEMYTAAYSLALADGVTINPTDIVIIFHAGTGNDVYLDIDFTPHDIPSVSLNRSTILKYYPGWELMGRSVKGIILPETASQEGFELAINGLVVANIGSQIGLLDLVDPKERLSVVGPWALEDRGLFNANGLLPSIPSAVNRYLFGHQPSKTVEIDVKSDTLIEIDTFKKTASNHPQIVKIPLNDNEFYLLENRYRPVYEGDHYNDLTQLIFEYTPANAQFINYKQVLRNDQFEYKNDFEFSERGVLINTIYFDAAIPHSGIVIWHIDQSVLSAKTASNQINEDPVFRGVRILEADGVDNLNRNIFGNQDERNDVFYAENDAPIYQNRINSESLPSTRSNYESAASGLELYNFSQSSETMSFQVKNTGLINRQIKGEIKFVGFDSITKSIDIIFEQSSMLRKERYDLSGQLLETINGPVLTGQPIKQFRKSGNSVWTYSTDSLFEFSLNDLSLQSVQRYEANIKQLAVLDNSLFILLANRRLYLQGNSPVQYSHGIVSLIELENSLVLHDSLNLVKQLKPNVGVFDYLGQKSDFYLDLNSELFSVSINGTEINTFSKNGVLAYNFPFQLPYQSTGQEIVKLKQFENLIMSEDDQKIIKVIDPQYTNLSTSYYLGATVINAGFFTNLSDRYVLIASQNRFIIDKIPGDKTVSVFNQPSNAGSVIDDKYSFLWPNPNLENTIHIRVYSTVTSIATARIFSETGRLIKTFRFNTITNQPVDYQWDVTEVASGTYIIQVEVDGEQKLMKAAVVH